MSADIGKREGKPFLPGAVVLGRVTSGHWAFLDGQGTMILDESEIELHAGVVVYIPREVKHKAVGNLTVLE